MESEAVKRSDGSDCVAESIDSRRWSGINRSIISNVSSSLQMGCLLGRTMEFSENYHEDVENGEPKLEKQISKASEVESMKERFSKLLLGEDMSGSGKGVCSAFTLSNAITNLYATVFGQLWRLEALARENKCMWRREIEWLLCVGDYIVEMVPSWQALPNGSRVEVMSSRPRLDLVINMPALGKLDNMLLEILDGFTECEFWYVDQGIVGPEVGRSFSFRKAIQRHEDKWWLPVPRVPPGGLSEDARKQLSQRLECAGQILKAASAINTTTLAEMEVPDSYLESLPKKGKVCVGDVVYRSIRSEHFSSECLLDELGLSSDDAAALELANRVEAAIHVWSRRPNSNLMLERARNLLLSLRQRFPGLTQTALDATKIHCNKDVGKSILESYSRVLESLAFNIVSRIEDLLYVDDITKLQSCDKNLSLLKVAKTTAYVYSPECLSSKQPAAASSKRVVTNYIAAPDMKVEDDGHKGSPMKKELHPFYMYSSLR